MSKPIYLAGAVRTPIGRFGGTLAGLSAPDLGVHAARAALARAGVPPEAVDQTLFGHGRQGGQGPNPGPPGLRPRRRARRRARLDGEHGLRQRPQERPPRRRRDPTGPGGGRARGRHGEHVEHAVHAAPCPLGLSARAAAEIVDGMYRDGFLCPLADQLMGATAENLVDQYDLTREEQDAYAVRTPAALRGGPQGGRLRRREGGHPPRGPEEGRRTSSTRTSTPATA